jgi:hypothetical protein
MSGLENTVTASTQSRPVFLLMGLW